MMKCCYYIIIIFFLVGFNACTQSNATSKGAAVPKFQKAPIAAFVPNIIADTSHFIVMLDAGHGGKDSGEIADSTKVTGKTKLSEKALNLRIALMLSRINKDSTIQFVYTRNTDTFISLKDRFIKAKNIRPNLYLSIHANDFYPDTLFNGIELYTVDKNNPHYEASNSFGNLLIDELHSFKGIKVNGWRTKKERLFVLRNAITPAILLELGYMSNRKDFNILLDKQQQVNISYKILQAIKTFKKQYPLPIRYQCTNWAYPFSYDTSKVFKEVQPLSDVAVPVIDGIEYNNALLTEINPDKIKSIQVRQATNEEIKKYGIIANDGIIQIETLHPMEPFLFKNQQEKIQYWAKRINIDSNAVGY